jgi:hypothetical protein
VTDDQGSGVRSRSRLIGEEATGDRGRRSHRGGCDSWVKKRAGATREGGSEKCEIFFGGATKWLHFVKIQAMCIDYGGSLETCDPNISTKKSMCLDEILCFFPKIE